MHNEKVALITGGARRVGAAIARYLHNQGTRLVIHYRASAHEAEMLCEEFNQLRPHSAFALQADLLHTPQLAVLIEQTVNKWGRLDALINNASSFYATPLGTITEAHWEDLLGSNLKASLFLSQAAAPFLQASQGSIINIIDIHARQPLKAYTTYCIAKAGLAMLTKSLAKELGPQIRVNGIAPGAILWPENANEMDKNMQAKVIAKTALKRVGSPEDIAKTAYFLIYHADYITGQIIAVDGGRSLDF
jgi:pteridine reductase